MGDTNDAGKGRQPRIAEVLRKASDDDSDTIYQPAPKQIVAPRSDDVPQRRNAQRSVGRFVAFIEFIVRRRRRAR
jgi:hypothetical protein